MLVMELCPVEYERAARAGPISHQGTKIKKNYHFYFGYFRIFFKSGLRQVEKRIPEHMNIGIGIRQFFSNSIIENQRSIDIDL